MTTSQLLGRVAVTTAVLVAAAGCGNNGAPAARVASLPATGPTTNGTANASASNRSEVDRQLPLGATTAQIDRAYKQYYACWTARGIPSATKGAEDGGPLLTYKLDPAKYQKQVDACANLEPLNPPELDPHTNPDYWDDLRDELRCMLAKGFRYEIRQGQPGLWKAHSGPATDAETQAENACELKSFRDR